MKTKIILISVLILIFVACTDTHIEVRIPIKRPDTVDFDQYERILVKDFDISVTPEKIAFPMSVTNFFLDDFAKFIGKEIRYFKPAEEDGSPPKTLEESLKSFPNALLITGSVQTEIKERNRISEKRNKYGDKLRTFVKVQNWSMKMEIRLLESDSGKVVRKFDFDDRLKDSEDADNEFNFKALFDRITDRFIQKVIRKETYQRRYLLPR